MSRPPPPAPTHEQELLQCLYALPVAVCRIDGAEGRIGLLNARAASLLQELGLPVAAADGFALLRALDAGVAARAEAHALAPGPLIARLPLQRRDRHGLTRRLALSVQVVNPGQVLLTLEEAWDAPPAGDGSQ